MTWKPHVVVAAVIEQDGRFLMVEETDNGAIVYNQPAGHLEENESLVNAVIREIQEETAWGFSPEAICGVYRWPHPDKNITYLRFCFTGKHHDHTPNQDLDNGILRALWMTREELVAKDRQLRSPMVLRCIDDFLSGQRYSLQLLNEFDDI